MYCRRDRLHIRGCGRGLFNDPHFLFCSLTTRRAGTFRRFPPLSPMHSAAKFQFERAVREFSQWRAVPEAERSPAPAWWWQPAFEVATHQEQMPRIWCHRLELPLSSTYAAGAAVLMATLADQTTLTWPDEFPRKIEKADKPEGS
jgi:hypothetical protein